MKTTLKLKINPNREYLELIFYPIKPLTGLFFLIKSRETIPLTEIFPSKKCTNLSLVIID
jgi:hypothetical protein